MFKKALLGSGLVGSIVSAHAAVPTAVSTAITDAGADMATVAGAVFVAIIGLLGFKLMRRAAK